MEKARPMPTQKATAQTVAELLDLVDEEKVEEKEERLEAIDAHAREYLFTCRQLLEILQKMKATIQIFGLVGDMPELKFLHTQLMACMKVTLF